MSVTPSSTSNKVPQSSARGSAKARLLLVEDDPFFATLLSRWIQRDINMDVVVVHDGNEGLRLIREGSFDVILSDINLPGASGLTLASESKAKDSQQATILITAEETVERTLAALRLHVDDLLFKPVTCESLVRSIRRALSHVREQRSRSARVVLAVGAHPDDVEIGCGGALLSHSQAGDRIIVLTLSQGTKHNAPTRVQESQRAAQILGADLIVGEGFESALSDGPETISRISQAVARYQPDVVYTHSYQDGHPDHRTAHLATLVAAHDVPSLLCFHSPSSTVDFHPTYFVDISAQVERKIQLLAAYQSQADRLSLAPELVRASARYWGRYSRGIAAEPMEVIRAHS